MQRKEGGGVTWSYTPSLTNLGSGKANCASTGNGIWRYLAILRMASDLMKLPDSSTSTMDDMSSGFLPLLCRRVFPASLCRAANRSAPFLSNFSAVLTPPLPVQEETTNLVAV